MLPTPNLALDQNELLKLDSFLRSPACGSESMGLSRAHGFLTALASGPEQLEPGEWLWLVFDEPVFANGAQAETMLGLAMRLYQDIESRLGNPGSFLPVLDFARDAGGVTVDASNWCRGYFSGMSVCREQWAWHASQGLDSLLDPILGMARRPPISQDVPYRRQCDALSASAEAVYRYWHGQD